MLDNAPNQQSRLRQNNLLKNDSRGKYNTNKQIKSKRRYKSQDLMKGKITEADPDSINNCKEVVFKNCAPFTDCMSKINNAQIDNSKGTDVVMSINNLIEYSNNYLKISECLLQYYIDELPLTDAGVIDKFSGNSTLFQVAQEITEKTRDDGKKGIEIMLKLKYHGNFRELLKCL